MEKKIPKYLVLVNWIKEQIEQNQLSYGDKFYSENELVNLFKVSRQTVRQAVGILEQEKILERRRGSGTYVIYQPKKIASKTKNIGLISTYLDQYIFPSIISGIENILTAHGYSMQISLTHNRVENERRVLQALLEKDLDGVIVEPTKSALPNPNSDLYQKIADKKIPLLFFNAYYQNLPFPHVSMDDQMAGEIATQYLISQGHKNIFALFQLDDLQGHLRYAGYMNALNQANIESKANNILWYASEEREEVIQDEQRFLKRLRNCTAILCYNDEVAFGVVRKLREKGYSVPEDISVMGIDDSTMSTLCEIPLTTVVHPGKILGEMVGSNLLQLIADPLFDATIDYKPSLIVRDSVKKII